jgi:predicted nuclease of restriction endonuclease-like RecB superfamily
MRAEISTKPGGIAFYELSSGQTGLRSHYLDTEGYENPTVERLAAGWARGERAWSLEASNEVIDLGESAFIPDYVLRRRETGERFYLEVLGFWTPQHLRARLREFEHAGVKNFLLAAWEDLRGSREPLPSVPPHVIVFKKNLDPEIVELAVEKLVSEEG